MYQATEQLYQEHKEEIESAFNSLGQIVPKHYNEFRKKRIENKKFVPFLIRCSVVWRPHP